MTGHEGVHDNGRKGEGTHRHEAELDHGREAEPDLVIPALVDERPVVLARPGHDLHVVVEDALWIKRASWPASTARAAAATHVVSDAAQPELIARLLQVQLPVLAHRPGVHRRPPQLTSSMEAVPAPAL